MDFSKAFSKPANILVPVLLFILLSPGLFFRLPDERSTQWTVVLTHAAVFAAIYMLLRTVFAAYY